MYKKTHYAKVYRAECCSEAMDHKNNVICQPRIISRAVKLFAGKREGCWHTQFPHWDGYLLAVLM